MIGFPQRCLLCAHSVSASGCFLQLQIQGSGAIRRRVAYQGMPGAFSELLARHIYPDMEPLPCEQYEVGTTRFY